MTDLKFKPGDRVMVPAKIAETGSRKPQYLIQLDDGFGVWVSTAALASAALSEIPLAVGDRVVWSANSGWAAGEGVIVDILGSFACVRRQRNHGCNWPEMPLSELRRAEERG